MSPSECSLRFGLLDRMEAKTKSSSFFTQSCGPAKTTNIFFYVAPKEGEDKRILVALSRGVYKNPSKIPWEQKAFA